MQGGLGSSAAATVAGLRLFERLAGARESRDLLGEATAARSHPDNVGGGAARRTDHQLRGRRRAGVRPIDPVARDVRLVVASPAVHATPEARGCCPRRTRAPTPSSTCSGRRSSCTRLSTADRPVIREALRDRWHQPYRAPLVPGLTEALALEHPGLLGRVPERSGPRSRVLGTGDLRRVERHLRGMYARRGSPCTVRRWPHHIEPGADDS